MPTLVELSTPGRLIPGAAAAFERAKEMGGLIGTTHHLHAHRDYAGQIRTFHDNYTSNANARLHHPIDMRPWRGVQYFRKQYGNAAAVPGTSTHGRGDTVDFQGLGSYGTTQFRRNSAILRENGFNNDEGERINESWHWSWNRHSDEHYEDNMHFTQKNLDDIADAIINRRMQDKDSFGGSVEKIERDVEALRRDVNSLTAPRELTPMARRIIKNATGEDRTDKVIPMDGIAYLQAIAFYVDSLSADAKGDD